MDMEKQANGAATSAQDGDLADVVAHANVAMASSSTSHHQQPRPPPPPPSAHTNTMVSVSHEEERRRPMSFACPAGMLEAVVPLPSVVVDPYLLAASSSGLPQQQQHQQLMAFQISEHAACCGATADVDGDDAMKISPPPAPPHQMIKRKNDVRKVVCIPAPPTMSNRAGGGGEVIPSDLWAWRKYGQKPIKGSPYPRGYYRCSSSKGCMARKQVERSRSDPNMLVITYTAEHNHPWPMHRNVLAGYARAHTQAQPAAAVKKHHRNSSGSADNVAAGSSPLILNHNSFHLQQNVIHGDQQGNHVAPAEMAGDCATAGGPMFEACSSVHPDEVFAELEELEPDHNSMMISAASVYGSRGVSSNYDWQKF